MSQDGYLPPAVITRKIEQREVAIAERGGAPVGYARLEYLWSKQPYLGLVRVEPTERRQGVGRALLMFLARELRIQGYKALYSSSQADEPESAAWHRHQGFVESGYLAGVNESGVDEIFFRLELFP